MVDSKGTGTRDTPHGHESREVLQGLLKLLEQIIKRQRIALSFVAGGMFLYFATPASGTIITGIPFILVGESIRTWASGFIKKEQELAQGGPYAFTRNPLYLGNFLIGIGFSIMAGNIVLIAIFLIIFTIIYSVTIKNEEKKLFDKFGGVFRTYRDRVPVFFPWVSLTSSSPFRQRGMSGSASYFDWRLFLRHREHHTWLGIVGCLIIFLVKLLYFSTK